MYKLEPSHYTLYSKVNALIVIYVLGLFGCLVIEKSDLTFNLGTSLSKPQGQACG